MDRDEARRKLLDCLLATVRECADPRCDVRTLAARTAAQLALFAAETTDATAKFAAASRDPGLFGSNGHAPDTGRAGKGHRTHGAAR